MFEALKTMVSNTITSNGNKEILAEDDRAIRNMVIDKLGQYEYAGTLTDPNTQPTTEEKRVYWFNTANTWVNFDNVETLSDEVGFLYKPNGTWQKVVIFTVAGTTSTTKLGAIGRMAVVGNVGATLNFTNESSVIIPLNITENNPINADYLDTDDGFKPRSLISTFAIVTGEIVVAAIEFPTTATLRIVGSNGNSLKRTFELDNPTTITVSGVKNIDLEESFHILLELEDSQNFSILTAELGISS